MFGTITVLLYQRKLWVSQITVFRIAREERRKQNFSRVFRKKCRAGRVRVVEPPCLFVRHRGAMLLEKPGLRLCLGALARERDGSGATDLGADLREPLRGTDGASPRVADESIAGASHPNGDGSGASWGRIPAGTRTQKRPRNLEVGNDGSVGSHDCASKGQDHLRRVLRRDLRLDSQARPRLLRASASQRQ